MVSNGEEHVRKLVRENAQCCFQGLQIIGNISREQECRVGEGWNLFDTVHAQPEHISFHTALTRTQLGSRDSLYAHRSRRRIASPSMCRYFSVDHMCVHQQYTHPVLSKFCKRQQAAYWHKPIAITHRPPSTFGHQARRRPRASPLPLSVDVCRQADVDI